MLSSMGLYFLELGTAEVILGSPSVSYAELAVVDPKTKESRTLVIRALDNSETNVFVQSVQWEDEDGQVKDLPDRVIRYGLLCSGGMLTFRMGSSSPRPN